MRLCVVVIALALLFACDEGDATGGAARVASEESLATPAPAEEGLEQPDAVAVELIAVVNGVAVARDLASGEITLSDASGPVAYETLGDEHPAAEIARAFRAGDALETKLQSAFVRTGERTGEVRFDNGTVATAAVSSDGFLADAWLLHADDNGIWIQQEELAVSSEEYKGELVHRLKAIGALRRYDESGALLASGYVVIEKPRTTLAYFSIDENGTPHYLEYKKGQMRPRAVVMASPDSLAALPREAALPPIIDAATEIELASFEAAVRATARGDELMPAETTRADILARANMILNTTWRLSAGNFDRSRPANCQGSTIWSRPRTLTPDLIGSEISAPPYKWGGNADLLAFVDAIGEGAVAGDVCTCRCTKGASCTARDWCIDESAVGFDCSGFVSQAWAIPYHSTSTLHAVAEPVTWQNMMVGDILNSPGRHVRLFVGRAATEALQFEMIESSVGCGGLCKKLFRVSELAGYIPYRAKHIVD